MADEPQKVEVTPTCRYGHGNLERQGVDENGAPIAAWCSPKMYLFTEIDAKHNDHIKVGDVAMFPNAGFVYSLYRCKVCGYIELFDHEFDQREFKF